MMTHQQRFGAQNGNVKLTAEQVDRIRRSEFTQRKLAEIYGVSQTCIAKILRGETWQAR